MDTVRKIGLLIGLLVLTLGRLPAWAVDDIVLANDLEQDGRTARDQGKPIVALVTASYCEYCTILKAEVFRFLTEDERFLLREIVIDSGWPVTDFNGHESGHGSLGQAYKVKLTPTVLFLADDGTELVEPLVGVLTLDYYSYYFDQRLADATATLLRQRN